MGETKRIDWGRLDTDELEKLSKRWKKLPTKVFNEDETMKEKEKDAT